MSPTFQLNDVTVITTHDIMIATLEHRSDPRRIGESVRKFIAWRKAHQLPPRVSATFNLLWDNPDQVPADEYRFDLGAAVTSPVAPNSDGMSKNCAVGTSFTACGDSTYMPALTTSAIHRARRQRGSTAGFFGVAQQ